MLQPQAIALFDKSRANECLSPAAVSGVHRSGKKGKEQRSNDIWEGPGSLDLEDKHREAQQVNLLDGCIMTTVSQGMAAVWKKAHRER